MSAATHAPVYYAPGELSSFDYHSETEHQSSSGLKRFIDNPTAYFHEYVSCTRPRLAPSKSMRIGSAFHAFCLERDTFEDSVAVASDGLTDRMDAFAVFMQSLPPGVIGITAEEMATVEAMYESLQRESLAMDLLFERPGRNESSLFWDDPASGVQLKCRWDRLLDGYEVVDIKTCLSPFPARFFWDAKDRLYHVSASLYRKGAEVLRAEENGAGEAPTFWIVAVQNAWPFSVVVHRMGQWFSAEGDRLLREAINDLRDCREMHGLETPWRSRWSGVVNELDYEPRG